MPSIFIEIYSEEIPVGFQDLITSSLEKNLQKNLEDNELGFGYSYTFSTPCRVGLYLEGISEKSKDKRIEKRGPKSDAQSKAIEGFAQANKVAKEDLEIRTTKNGEYYFYTTKMDGIEAIKLLPEIITLSLQAINLPKSMCWGSNRAKWVRPIRSMVGIFTNSNGSQLIPFEFAGVNSGTQTFGHKFMSPKPIHVDSFETYKADLRKAKVIIDPEERKEIIINDVKKQCEKKGLQPLMDNKLIDEIVGIVEWPVVMLGEVREGFQSLPAKVLSTTMKKHQKYIPVSNKGEEISSFIVVANMETVDNGKAILRGNQRVLSSRLGDSKFFLDQDFQFFSEHGLKGALAKLDRVSYYKGLGTQRQRVDRIVSLTSQLCNYPCFDEAKEYAEQASYLLKSDLVSQTVNELPELQGTMGEYFARAEKLPSKIATAIGEHYLPYSQDGPLPKSIEGMAVSLADKINHLVGFSLIGASASGLGDPNAVRRSAIGIIRIIVENNLQGLKLKELIWLSIKAHHQQEGLNLVPTHENQEQSLDDIFDFLSERFKNYTRRKVNIEVDIINACLGSLENDDFYRVFQQITILDKFLNTPQGGNLLQLYRRTSQLVSSPKAVELSSKNMGLNKSLIQEGHEKEFYETLNSLGLIKSDNSENGGESRFFDTLKLISSLREPLDAYLDNVMVLSGSREIQKNRIALVTLCISELNKLVDLRFIQRK